MPALAPTATHALPDGQSHGACIALIPSFGPRPGGRRVRQATGEPSHKELGSDRSWHTCVGAPLLPGLDLHRRSRCFEAPAVPTSGGR